MRWIHIDDIIEFEEGKSARAVRSVPSNAEYLVDRYPGFPVMPHSLLIESMAQTAGILLGASFGFQRDVILAKIDRVEFFAFTRPGDRLIIHAGCGEIREEGARMECRITLGEKEIARGSLFFTLLGDEGARKVGARHFVFPPDLLARFKLVASRKS